MRFTYDGELSGVTFIDAEHGWLPEGASIYATTDGGATWTPHDAGISTTAVSFVDDLHGYAVGPGGAMAITTDGGATWQVRGTTTPAGGIPLLSGLAFPDATNGWAVGGHSILATADGGATWTSQTVDADLRGVSFPDTTNGWAVGGIDVIDNVAVVLHTADGGLSWQTQLTSTSLRGTKTPIRHLTSGSLGCSDALLAPLYGVARRPSLSARTPIRSPQANAFAERLVKTLRHEALDWTLILGRRHLDRVLASCSSHYNAELPHRGIALTGLSVLTTSSCRSVREASGLRLDCRIGLSHRRLAGTSEMPPRVARLRRRT